MKVLNATIGTDFELFVKNETDNEIISAEGYIQGTKENPFVFDPVNKYFSTTLDNVLAEATIPPVTNALDFYNYIQKSMEYLKSQIPRDCSLVAFPAFRLHDRWLQTDNAKLFGCEPDFCAWTRETNEPPCSEGNNLRSAGGHIHVGYDDPSKAVSEEIVKAMDLFLGIPSVLQEPDNERKRLYGKAGCFRFKDYGVEYRTISNYYLQSKQLTEWAFNNTLAAINFVNDGGNDLINKVVQPLGEEDSTFADLIPWCINNNDKRLAEILIKYFNIKLAA